ncbi:MAG: FG-GAP-like repeat-containing protein [Prevotellaceae bacterium]|nr:FG-GAP-like repeat-containing protein [Prevotellaceae bacterium]
MKKTGLLALLLSGTTLSVTAQSAHSPVARNDTLRTGPLQRAKKNVILNDEIPTEPYSWRLLTVLNATTQGVAEQQGDYVVFTPSAACRNTSFNMAYELTSNHRNDTAEIVVIVSDYNNPVNVVPSDIMCAEDMPLGVTFDVHEKFRNTAHVLDGFSMPLVGDINGDGKPDIIALGLGRAGDYTMGTDLAARAWYVHIFDGQTGERTWSINLGTEPAANPLTNVTSLNHPGITTVPLDEVTDQFQLRYDPRHNSPGHLAIADLDNDGLGEIVVVECGNLGKVYALKPVVDSGRNITGFTVYWEGNNNGAPYSYKTPVTGNHEVFGSGTPYIADINGDGVPEVIVYNKIFNGRTGHISCVLETLNQYDFPVAANSAVIKDNYAYVGRRPKASWRDEAISCMVIADINNDGILDIVAGSKVYIMKDANGTPALDYIIYGPSRVTMQKGTGNVEFTTYVADGFTAVADIDMDGYLDVIVLAPAAEGLSEYTRNILYVWDPLHSPASAKAALYLYTRSYTGTMSFPFVGDINGHIDNYGGDKRLPEICFNGGRFYTSATESSKIAFHPLSSVDLTAGGITGASIVRGFNFDTSPYVRGHIVGFTYHANPDGSTPLHQRLKLAWAMEHDDESSSTGITMFDFDNDNIKELCYRDENSVRVISPALKTYITNTENTGAIRFKHSNIRSYTGFEAPVIADVDIDGSADIVTLVYPGTEAPMQSKGYLYVYEHAPGSDQWAPCPPVWNQTIYFPLQINADLTVPAKPHPILTPYTDRLGNTIFPYNGQWIQQPIVRAGANYVPVVRQPDMTLHNMSVRVESATRSIVTLTISNRGSASINAQVPVTFYDGGTAGLAIDSGATVITVMPTGIDIFPGEKITRDYELAGDFTNKLVWARLADDAVSFPATGYDECNIADNTFSAIDCPDLIYHVVSDRDVLCDTTHIILTATPVNTPDKPSYQWYRDDLPIAGETGQQLEVATTGEYKCYIIDSICRGFSDTKTIDRVVVVANPDYVDVIAGIAVKIPVLANDQTSPDCPAAPVIIRHPANGTASMAGDSVVYQPAAGFTGFDTLEYTISATAEVYIHVIPMPDNMTDAACFTTPPASSWSIGSGQSASTAGTTALYQSVLVGDIDGDGFTELLAPAGVAVDNWKAGYPSDSLHIYDTRTGTTTSIATARFATSDLGPVGIAKAHASEAGALIVVAAIDGFLYAYDKAGTQQWKSNSMYMPDVIPGGYTYRAGAVGFADFNGDGYAEVYIKDKLFDLQTGVLLLDVHDATHMVCDLGTAVADFDSDGRQELVIRGKVYRVAISHRTDSAGNSYSLWKEVTGNPHPDAGMATIVADFDLDGKPDILVHSREWFYIWDPYTGQVKLNQSKGTGYEGAGCPAVGDIDDDGYPEIIYSGKHHITAWDIDGNTTGTVKWKRTMTDESGFTGLTLFDFNQDGTTEIVCRDETRLYVIDGSSAASATNDLMSISCTSGTQGEYPAIADIDGDHQAEIIITGGAGNASQPAAGDIRIVKAADGHRWAEARPVWNQYAYNSLYVNDDLSVPAAPASPQIVFPGNDGLPGTPDDVRPYNAFLQQPARLNRHGNPLWPAPNVTLAVEPAFDYHAATDRLYIRLTVINNGSAALDAPYYITAYDGTATKLATGVYSNPLHVADTAALLLIIPDFSESLPTDSIVVRLNDRGRNRYEQPECNYTDNRTARPTASIPMAHNDCIMVAADTAVMPVIDNDSIPTPCRPPADWGIAAGSTTPAGGTVTATAGSAIIYLPPANFTGTDSVDYYIKCNADSTTARLYIVRAPDVTISTPAAADTALCAGASIVLRGSYTDDGTIGNILTARWEYSPARATDTAARWTAIDATGHTSTTGHIAAACTITGISTANAGYYRLAISHPDTIDARPCRAASRTLHIGVDTLPPPPVILVATPVCAGDELIFSTKPLYDAFEWRDNNAAGAIAGTHTYIVKRTTGTHTQVVRARSASGCWSAYSDTATGVINPAPAPAPVTVNSLAADFAAATPTVTFQVAWPAGSRNCRHRPQVWVFVDRIPVPAGAADSWTRAALDGAPAIASADTAVHLATVAGNSHGFWLHGTGNSTAATLTVPLSTISKAFSWCAYAMDYPPNATENSGYYDLHGTPPFVINNDTLPDTERRYSLGCINTLTDATASPGLLPEAPTIVSVTADPATVNAGDTATLSITATRAAIYSFDDGNTWTTAATHRVSPGVTTTYRIKIRSLAGCTVAATVTVTVN